MFKYVFTSLYNADNFPYVFLVPVSSSLNQIAGIAILGVGIWVKVDSGSILNFLGKIENAPKELSQVLSVGYLLIAIGAILLITGFLGCCGGIRESKCMLLLVGLQLYRQQKIKFNIMPFVGSSLNIKYLLYSYLYATLSAACFSKVLMDHCYHF